MNDCYADLAATADERRARYFAAAIKSAEQGAAEMASVEGETNTAVVTKLRESEAAFEAYRDAECGAVWEEWHTGTIRTVMSLACQIELTDKRTHTIWQNWLTYMGSTEPVLPLPEPTLSHSQTR